jgi:hypothetical protein
MRPISSTLAVAGSLLLAAGAASAQTVLAADVIRQSFAGNTGEIGDAPNIVYVHWAADGTQRMLNPRSGPDQGKWRITPEGDFCGVWTKARGGAEACAPIVDLGGGQYQWGNAKFRILLGNPKGL